MSTVLVRAEEDPWVVACREAAGPSASDGAVRATPGGWSVRCDGHDWPVDRLPTDAQGRIELLWTLLGRDRPTRAEGLALPPPPAASAPPPVRTPPRTPPAPAPVDPAPLDPSPVAPAPIAPAPVAPAPIGSALADPAPIAPIDAEPDPSRPRPQVALSAWTAVLPSPSARIGAALELRTRAVAGRLAAGRTSALGRRGTGHVGSLGAAVGPSVAWRALRFEALVGGSRRIARGFSERTAAWIGEASSAVDAALPLPGDAPLSLLVGVRAELDLQRTWLLEARREPVPRAALGVVLGLAVGGGDR